MDSIYQQLGNCNCTQQCPCSVTPDPCPTSACGANCFILTTPLVQPVNSVGPCQQVGVIPISEDNQYASCTGSDLVYTIEGYDEVGFDSVVFVDGDIQFTTSSTAVPNTYYEGVYRVRCKSTGQGGYGRFYVGIKDLCQYVSCNSGYVCNKCTGECEAAPIDLQVLEEEGSVTQFIDLQVIEPEV